MDLTEETIISILIEGGGRLKNTELLSKFNDSLNCTDLAEKKKNRDLFKRIVNTVAVVKEFEDVRYIVRKKKYQQLLPETNDVNIQNTESEDIPEPGKTSPVPDRVQSVNDQNGGTNISPEILKELVIPSVSVCFTQDSDAHSHIEEALQNIGDFKPKRFLNVNIDTSSGGAVYPGKAEKTRSVQKPFALPLRMPPSTSRVEIHKLRSDEGNDPPSRGFTGQNAHTSSQTKRKPSTDSVGRSSPLPRRAVKTIKPSEEPKYSSMFALDETEHKWLVRCTTGQWQQVYGMLLNDVQLAEKRDFISGFTVLHWAAKCGNSEMVKKIISTSRQGRVNLDINARSHGGYTPLHIAALHDQEAVLTMLARDYGADANVRDNCGKKPYHYLNKGMSTEVREMLGQPKTQVQEVLQLEREEQDAFPGLHTISRLFNPHVEKKKKYKQRAPFLSLGDDPRGESDERSSKHRPVSEVFM